MRIRQRRNGEKMDIDVNTGNLYRVYAGIDLDAIRSNILAMKKNMHRDAKIMAVVKTDGYGHGAYEVAKAVEDMAEGYGVATAEEAVSLREHGIDKMILVLGYVHESLYEEMIMNGISLDLYTLETAQKLSALGERLGKKALVHMKLDTGMSRLGAKDNEEGLWLLKEFEKLPGISLEGLFTHFSSADERDKKKTERQLKRFRAFLHEAEGAGIKFPFVHCSNSGALIDLPEANFNLVRAGIAMYGLYPSEEVQKERVPLVPALCLKSHIIFIKEVEKGVGISYGETYVTKDTTRVATIPVGYGDGYMRALSNVGYVLIRGQKAPILGRICMDQFMVDVTGITGAAEGDTVTLIGKDGEESITVEDLADLAGNTFNYEVVCDLGKRIPRVYFRGKRAVSARYYKPCLS